MSGHSFYGPADAARQPIWMSLDGGVAVHSGQMLRRVAAIAVISALSTTARADPLETASRLYDNKEYEAASGELLAVLGDDARSDEVTKQRAQMMMARTL